VYYIVESQSAKLESSLLGGSLGLWSSSFEVPCLFSFARDQRISVKNVMEVHDLASLFALPLSEQAHDELQAMQNELLSVPFDDDQKDIWTFMWGS